MVIGITGGVGCGKSTVLDVLNKKYNAHIIDADKVAHRLMEPFGQAYEKVRDYFGDEVISDDGCIDRKKLGQIVFNNKEKLEKLNGIVHPLVKEAIKKEIKAISSSDKNKLIAVEAALFIEAGYTDICDELWYIYTDKNIRIERLMNSRGYSVEKAESIIANQLSDEKFRKNCQIVIDNSKDTDYTETQIAEVILYTSKKQEVREKWQKTKDIRSMLYSDLI